VCVSRPTTLVNVPVHRCTACGDFEVEIPLIVQLNQALADALIRQPSRLTGAEIRFLRKALGWSGVDFARHMGVDAATVSRWEAGQRMGASAERLLRLAVSVGTPAQDYSLDHLATDLSETTEHVPMRFECADDAWQLVA
jgi:putative transcriptional regulator